mgnify:CR=1 FL=1
MILLLIDFDGVILDTKKISFDIFSKCLKKLQNCKDLKLIKKLYKKSDGFDLLTISKLLANYYKTDYLTFYKFLEFEWKEAYKKKTLNKDISNFFDFIKNLDVKIVIFSSSDFKNIKKILLKKLKKIDFIKKEFDHKFLLNKTTLDKIKKLKKGAQKFINIDDNININKQISKLNFINIHYEINTNKKDLTEIFISTLLKNRINFYYKISSLNRMKLESSNFKLPKSITKSLINKFNKFKNKGFFNGNLNYLHDIGFKNKKLYITSFKNYYSLRLSRHYISLAVQGFIIIGLNKYLICKRKKVIFEKNLYEFVPSGGLTKFSKRDLFFQIKNECYEESNLKINNKDINFIAIYVDFDQNTLDFICKINIKKFDNLKNQINLSNEHWNFILKDKKYLKNNINKFTNSSKKVINNL